jgi:5'-phosphate synthase pdxT subunit
LAAKTLRIGVLALQGAFLEHIQILRRLGAEATEVRLPEQLHGLTGLIIPGGESTTIGKLAVTYGLMDPLRKFAADHPVWGTCAGLIFLAKETDSPQPLLGVMDILAKRNAFGRQVDSFETDLFVPVLENGASEPFHAVFIRAPYIAAVKGNARVLAKLSDGTAVAVREGKWLATAFHPELTSDLRFHRYFLQMCRDN